VASVIQAGYVVAMATTGKTELLKRLGIEHPIVQGPFGGGFSTVALASSVSNLGGMGSFGAGSVPADKIGALVAELRAATSAPFTVNLWLSNRDPGGDHLEGEELARAQRMLQPYLSELGLEWQPTLPQAIVPDPEAQIDALLEARPPVFSFIFGVPRPAVLAECRRRGILTVGSATSVAEAEALDQAGVDVILATGFEAGGHRPSFLERAEDSLYGTMALVPMVVDRVKAPVIAAGGIADRRGVAAALALGASAALLGTAFLACEESGAPAEHRALLFSPEARTTLTRAFTGRLARSLRNRWTEELGPRAAEYFPFPVQHWLVSQLRQAAIAAHRTDLISLWAGQIAPVVRHRTVAALMGSLVD